MYRRAHMGPGVYPSVKIFPSFFFYFVDQTFFFVSTDNSLTICSRKRNGMSAV